jgi:hypothetical protein
MNLIHKIINAGLAGRGPLGVMLADDFRRVAKDIGTFDALKTDA